MSSAAGQEDGTIDKIVKRLLALERFPRLVGPTLFALCLIATSAWAQDRNLSDTDAFTLTPAQQSVVDRITRSPRSADVGVR